MSDILTAADRRQVTLLDLLDLSAAFDCVDHDLDLALWSARRLQPSLYQCSSQRWTGSRPQLRWLRPWRQSVDASQQTAAELDQDVDANSIGYSSVSVSSSKWHVWFASRCPSRRLSIWQIVAASWPTALGALCGQLTFRLAWCRQHSAFISGTFEAINSNLVRRCQIPYPWRLIDQYRNRK